MSISARIAIVLALLFIAVAAIFVFVPWRSEGAECGSLVAPEWTEDEVDDLADEAEEMSDAYNGYSYFQDTSNEMAGIALNARRNGRACDQSRSTRTIVASSAGGAALVLPLAVLFIGRGRRQQPPAYPPHPPSPSHLPPSPRD